jgi:hypothetical protein
MQAELYESKYRGYLFVSKEAAFCYCISIASDDELEEGESQVT